MENQGEAWPSSNNISTEDILKALDAFGDRVKSPASSKACNRDSGLSESSSFISDPLSAFGEGQTVFSDNEQLSDFTNDNFSVISDPLGALSTSDGEGDNDIHVFETKPWDEKQVLEREWKTLFKSDDYFYELSQHALSGKLRHSKYRSIAWKLFLECLPEDQSQWISKTKQLRHEYKTFKQKSLIDPSKSKEEEESLHILHPLSLDESSPWQQYFKDKELKALIKQDLDRLYPEIEFFCNPRIKETMLNLLFCYVKKNESLGYKQGMHELLAPIVYVLECDSKAHKYADGDGLGEIIRCLLDPAYTEHDAFAMFCQLMDVTEAWYQHHKIADDSTTFNNKFLSNSEPFAAPLSAPPTAIVKKLNKIQDHLLRKHDTDLWFHLKEMNIEPQVYGLRWIRLLFSREFPFQDVLVIWDALFAEGRHLDLVEYIYIVMLQAIRNKLMIANYTTCLSYLMNFPHIKEDVHSLVKRALNLRGTKKSRPTSRTLQSAAKSGDKKSVHHLDLSKHHHSIKKQSPRRPHSALANFTKRYTTLAEAAKPAGLLASKQEQILQSKELLNKPFREPRPDPLTSPPLSRDRTDSTGSSAGRAMKSLSNELKTKLSRPRSRSKQSVEELEKDHQRLQVQVSELNGEIDRMQSMYLYCGRKLDSYIGLVQEEMTKDSAADRDVIYLSLAGLKQVRDLLKGTLSYRGSTMESEKDFVDIDQGIATRLQVSSPNVRPGQMDGDNQNELNKKDTSTSETHSEMQPTQTDTSIIKDNTDDMQSNSQENTQEASATGRENDNIDTEYGCQDSLNCKNTSTPRPCSINNLNSYIQEHLNNSQSITTVPCTVGSAMGSLPSLSKDDFRSNISTPDESFGKDFVFVNRDGTAVKSADVSPRLSPTHPLLTSDNEDDGDAV